MLQKRRIRALGLLLAVSFAAACLKGESSKLNSHDFAKVVIPVKTGINSDRPPRAIPGVFVSNLEREDRVPGQLQRFARCFFPPPAPIKKADTNFAGDHKSRRYSKIYLARDLPESELFFDERIRMKEHMPHGDFNPNTTSKTRVKGTGERDLLLTSQQTACLKSLRDHRDLDRAKRIYRRIIRLQESRAQLVKGLIQFNQTSDDAFQLRLNELNQAINAYQAKFFTGSSMKRRQAAGAEFDINDDTPIAMLPLRSGQKPLSDMAIFEHRSTFFAMLYWRPKEPGEAKDHADRPDQHYPARRFTLSH